MSWQARAVLALAMLGGCRVTNNFDTDVNVECELGPDAAVAIVDRLLQPRRSPWDAAIPVEDTDR